MCLWHARREQQQLLGQLQAGHRAATQGGASHVQVRARRRGGGARWAAWLLCWSRPAMQAAHAGSSCRLPSLMLPSVMPGCTPPPPLQELLRDTLGAQSQVAQWVQLVRGEGSGGAAAAAAH